MGSGMRHGGNGRFAFGSSALLSVAIVDEKPADQTGPGDCVAQTAGGRLPSADAAFARLAHAAVRRTDKRAPAHAAGTDEKTRGVPGTTEKNRASIQWVWP